MKYESKQNRMSWLPEWQKQIIRKYPGLYTEPSAEMLKYYERYPEGRPAPDDFTNLRFGFECGPGWAGLLKELSQTAMSLVGVLRSFGFQCDAAISPIIVKEKYGTLRWQGADNILPPFRRLWWSYTSDIEQRSSSICEVSGEFGVLRDVGRGWVRTLCEEEFKKELERQKKG